MTFLDNGRVASASTSTTARRSLPRAFMGPRSGVNLVFEAEPGYHHANQDGAIVLAQFEHGPRALHEGRSDDQPPVAVRTAPSSTGSPSTGTRCACGAS